MIVHGPKGEDKARALVDCYNNVYRLSLPPSIKRSAAIIKDAYISITPDTSILHIPLLLQFMLITKRDGPQWPMSRSQSSLGKKLTI